MVIMMGVLTLRRVRANPIPQGEDELPFCTQNGAYCDNIGLSVCCLDNTFATCQTTDSTPAGYGLVLVGTCGSGLSCHPSNGGMAPCY